MTHVSRIGILLTTVLVTSLACVAQTRIKQAKETPVPHSYLLSVPWAEYQLEPLPAGFNGYQFCNRGAQTIKEARFGCIAEDEGRLVVLSERAVPTVRDLAPVTQGVAAGARAGAEGSTVTSCVPFVRSNLPSPGDCEGAKLAVVYVRLADGTEWELTRQRR